MFNFQIEYFGVHFSLNQDFKVNQCTKYKKNIDGKFDLIVQSKSSR